MFESALSDNSNQRHVPRGPRYGAGIASPARTCVKRLLVGGRRSGAGVCRGKHATRRHGRHAGTVCSVVGIDSTISIGRQRPTRWRSRLLHRRRKGDQADDLAFRGDADLVVASGSHLAVGLHQHPGQQRDVVVRRDIANLDMPFGQSLLE